jgi:ABC-2 type transport system permease protein
MSRDWFELTWLVALRELRQGARARSFRIVTVVLVLAVAAAVVIPALVHGRDTTKKVGIVGGSRAAMTRTVQTAARIAGATVKVVPLPDVTAARAQVRSGALAAVLVSDREVLVKQAPSAGNASSGSSLAGALAQVGGLSRLFALVPADSAAAALRQGVNLPIHGLKPPLANLTSRLTGLSITIVIYIIILVYGGRITTGVSEEKSSRVIEVLLATVRPAQLLIGKVLGMGIQALVQVAAIMITYVVLGLAVGSSLIRTAPAEVLGVGAMWILLGYAFYCTAYAAAGALIDRQSDAYNVSLPVQLPLIVAYMLSFTVLYADSVYAFYWFLAFFPPTAPISMTVLVAVGVAHPWHIALSAVLSLAGTVGMAWVAGTIYGRAILHTGGRLKLRQVLRGQAS